MLFYFEPNLDAFDLVLTLCLNELHLLTKKCGKLLFWYFLLIFVLCYFGHIQYSKSLEMPCFENFCQSYKNRSLHRYSIIWTSLEPFTFMAQFQQSLLNTPVSSLNFNYFMCDIEFDIPLQLKIAIKDWMKNVWLSYCQGLICGFVQTSTLANINTEAWNWEWEICIVLNQHFCSSCM